MAHHDKKGKGKVNDTSLSGYPTAWGGWIWGADRGLWYRERKTARNEWEYEWERQSEVSSVNGVAPSSTSNIPRAQYPSQSSASWENTTAQQFYNTASDSIRDLTDNSANILPTDNTLSIPADALSVKTRNPHRTEEKFDQNYRQHKKSEFKVGKVIKVLWVEQRGGGDGLAKEDSEYSFRGRDFSKIRRFVIVNLMAGHFIGIAINTYGGQGTKKPGLHLGEHAIIYTSPEPIVLPGERFLEKPPIKVRPYTSAHNLPDYARLNYAKVYTFEYNVKLQFIGEVDKDWRWKVAATYNQVHPPLTFSAPSTYSSLPTNSPSTSPWVDQFKSTTWSSGLTNSEAYYPTDLSQSSRIPTYIQSGSCAGESDFLGMPPQRPQWSIPVANSPSFVLPAPASVQGELWQTLNSQAGGSTSSSYQPIESHPAGYRESIAVGEYDSGGVGLAGRSVYSRSPSDIMSTLRPDSLPTPSVRAAKTTPVLPPITQDTSVSDQKQITPDDMISLSIDNSQNPYLDAHSDDQSEKSLIRYNRNAQSDSDSSVNLKLRKVDDYIAGEQFDSKAAGFIVPPTLLEEHFSGTVEPSMRKQPPSKTSESHYSSTSPKRSTELDNSSRNISLDAAGPPRNSDRILDFLEQHENIQSFHKAAMQKLGSDDFEKYLTWCVIRFAEDLKTESSSTEIKQAAQELHSNLKRIVRSVGQDLGTGNPVDKEVLGTNYSLESAASKTEDAEVEAKQPGLGEDPEIPGLDEFLKTSNAFRLLEENMDLLLHSDPVKSEIIQLWPETCPLSASFSIKYILKSEAITLLRNSDHFQEGTKLGDILTLTGDCVTPQAQSCRDCLVATWPEIGSLLLDALEDGIQVNSQVSRSRDDMELQINTASSDEMNPLISNINCLVTAKYSIHCQMVAAMSWLSAAIRCSPYEGVRSSSVTVEAHKKSGDRDAYVEIGPAELEEFSVPKSCWQDIFPHSVLANGFPSRSRDEGVGLEISFELMLKMSRGLRLAEYDGGLLVMGLRFVLIPIKQLRKDKAIQWHLEYTRSPGRKGRRSISKIMDESGISEWYKVLQPISLGIDRCFLGWVDKAVVVIASESFSTIEVKASGARRVESRTQITSHSINMGLGFGIQGFGNVGISGSQSRAPVGIPSFFTLPIDKDIEETLEDDSDDAILLYDTGKQIAWLLPKLSVVLYLAQVIARRRKYTFLDEDSGTQQLDFSILAANGASEALSVLSKAIFYKVQKSWSRGIKFEERFGKTIGQIFLAIDHACEGVEYTKTGETAPRFLHGIDFTDIARLKRSICVRQVKVDQAWVHLSGPQSLVLFCNDLGQPITPAESNTLCKPWLKVPSNCNYMVAPTQVIAPLLRHSSEGARLDDKIEWHSREILVQSHHHGGKKAIFHVQEIAPTETANSDANLQTRIDACLQGCLIFAAKKTIRACREKICTENGGRQQTNVFCPSQSSSSPFRTQRTPVQDIPDGSSDTSSDREGNKSDAENHSRLTSSQNSAESSEIQPGTDNYTIDMPPLAQSLKVESSTPRSENCEGLMRSLKKKASWYGQQDRSTQNSTASSPKH